VQRDERAVRRVHAVEVDGARPSAACEHVHELEGIARCDREHEQLQRPEQRAGHELNRPEPGGDRPEADRQQEQRRCVDAERPRHHSSNRPGRLGSRPRRDRTTEEDRDHDGEHHRPVHSRDDQQREPRDATDAGAEPREGPRRPSSRKEERHGGRDEEQHRDAERQGQGVDHHQGPLQTSSGNGRTDGASRPACPERRVRTPTH
jgi:hypothetical protein